MKKLLFLFFIFSVSMISFADETREKMIALTKP